MRGAAITWPRWIWSLLMPRSSKPTFCPASPWSRGCVERLDAGADAFENVAQAEDFDLLAHADDALLDLAGRHRAPALDGVNAFDGHEERLVDGPLRLRDVAYPERRAARRCTG